ncbi:interleukin-5 receptor subunit alpha-like [Engraulis encrasicolus]|uniref:interleukin-5 receptor subunit alpha-like n=1 Tax=Engraulis encrasicolus TaxID=184585 RepID=UPI002FCF8C89
MLLQCCSLLMGLLWSSVPTWAAHSGQGTLNIDEQCPSEQLKTMAGFSLFVENSTGQMSQKVGLLYIDTDKLHRDHKTHTSALQDLYNGLGQPSARFLLRISCVLDSQKLNCSWNNTDVPANAEYTITGRFCSKKQGRRTKSRVLSSWNCTLYEEGTLTGCEGAVESTPEELYATVIQVNVSSHGLWYIHTERFATDNIEKLDPPRNINWSFTEGNRDLQVQWDRAMSRSVTKIKCDVYQINIDEAMSEVRGELSYIKQEIDRNRKYKVQLRASRHDDCRTTTTRPAYWSDWTEPIEVGPAEEPEPKYSLAMILAIVLGFPMVLLVFLLLSWKMQRVLFPPIPRPNKHVKQLLEKDFVTQPTADQHAEEVQFDLVSEVEMCSQ